MIHISTRAVNDALDRDPPSWRGAWQRMGGPTFMGALSPMAIVLALALILAPAIRTVAIEINHSAATVWPFSWDHCSVRSTPGCSTLVHPGDSPGQLATALPPALSGQPSR